MNGNIQLIIEGNEMKTKLWLFHNVFCTTRSKCNSLFLQINVQNNKNFKNITCLFQQKKSKSNLSKVIVVKRKQSTTSICGLASPGNNNKLASVGHACNTIYGGSPKFWDTLKKLLPCMEIPLLTQTSSSHWIPYMFNGIKIWRLCWARQNKNIEGL